MLLKHESAALPRLTAINTSREICESPNFFLSEMSSPWDTPLPDSPASTPPSSPGHASGGNIGETATAAATATTTAAESSLNNPPPFSTEDGGVIINRYVCQSPLAPPTFGGSTVADVSAGMLPGGGDGSEERASSFSFTATVPTFPSASNAQGDAAFTWAAPTPVSPAESNGGAAGADVGAAVGASTPCTTSNASEEAEASSYEWADDAGTRARTPNAK